VSKEENEAHESVVGKRGKTAVLGVPVALIGAPVTGLFPVSTQISLYPQERGSRFL
jgi:hypothetical protein